MREIDRNGTDMRSDRNNNRNFIEKISGRSLGIRLFHLIFVISILTALYGSANAERSRKPELSIRILPSNAVQLTGDIFVNDRILLYSREYRSSDHTITDKLIGEAAAETDGSAELMYNPFAEPLDEARFAPDFEYQGNEITIKALYAVVSDGVSEARSDLVFIDCYLDTGVVNQYWCSLAGSTACGTAAGVIAMQMAYPSSGDDLFTRLNEMRKYCLLGDDFSTGPAEYFLSGEHISNGVNKYITEELAGGLALTDHRTPDKTTEEILIELLTTGRPAVIEVCYLRGTVTRDFQGISHWITVNGFSRDADGYTFRFADPITVSYRSISSEMLDVSNANVSYGDSGYIPVRYIGAFSEPVFSIELR